MASATTSLEQPPYSGELCRHGFGLCRLSYLLLLLGLDSSQDILQLVYKTLTNETPSPRSGDRPRRLAVNSLSGLRNVGGRAVVLLTRRPGYALGPQAAPESKETPDQNQPGPSAITFR